MADMKPPFRIAIRTEGPWVVAYLASLDTMKEALELGRMLKVVFDGGRTLFDEWNSLLKRAVSDTVKEVTGFTIEKFVETIPDEEPAD